jgi:hypothetical protein
VGKGRCGAREGVEEGGRNDPKILCIYEQNKNEKMNK